MPSKKKKYNARFPPARIKKIMQSDEEVGKVAQVVPIIISKSLESFVEQLLQSSAEVTRSRNARTLTPTHIKTSILQKPEFGFLRDIAQTIQDVSSTLEEAGDAEPEAGPVDFSIRSHNNTNNEQPARISTTTRPTSSGASGVLNLSNAGGAGSPPIQGPRPRGRPRKPRPGDATFSPVIPSTVAAVTSSSHPLPPKKNAAGRLSYFNSSPNSTVTMPSSTPLIGTSPSTSSGSGSSFDALTSVISLTGGGGNSNLPQVQPPSIHQYQQTVTTSTASPRNESSSASAATKRKTFNSDQDSDCDNDGNDYGEDNDVDDDTTEEEDEDEEEEVVSLRKSPKLTTTSSQQQRASVLVANPSIAPVTSNDEDDDYDNC